MWFIMARLTEIVQMYIINKLLHRIIFKGAAGLVASFFMVYPARFSLVQRLFQCRIFT